MFGNYTIVFFFFITITSFTLLTNSDNHVPRKTLSRILWTRYFSAIRIFIATKLEIRYSIVVSENVTSINHLH